jgi:hypothetical protein
LILSAYSLNHVILELSPIVGYNDDYGGIA